MSLQIHPLSYALGAEITGIDIRNRLDDESLRQVRAAFLEYGILLFRAQPLTREQHIAFSRLFGEVYPNDEIVDGQRSDYPEILVNRPEPGKLSYSGRVWHSDQCYSLSPAKATLLRGIEVPTIGGDTMFSNMYLAYESLSEGMKKLIAGLDGVHFGGKRRIDRSTPERLAETRRRNTVAQPIVRVHPETGRKALYLGEKVKQLVGMTMEESKPLLEYLCNHATRPQFVYRHRWQKDDLIMWDNRCTLHIAVGDYDRHEIRHMEKTTVRGTPSGYIYDGPVEYEGPRL